ncbi:MAG: MCE family protein [Deltaproteobacteria bacterium]|nr:MCE family protein [Deltaproteobacteria bacterium]
MKLEYSKKEKLAGIFVIGVIVILIAIVVIIGKGRSWFKSHITYYAMFNESYNLKVNGDVKLYKANIGKIKNITPAENRVKVELLILEEFSSRIRAGTIVTVESPTFIGSEYISVYPGNTEQVLVAENGVIPSREKKSISDIMEEFQIEKTAKMLIKTVQDFSNVAQTLQAPSGPLFSAIEEFKNTFANLQEITGSVNNGKGTIGDLINSKETINSVNDITASIKDITVSIDEAVGFLKKASVNIEKGSEDVPKITDTTVKGIEEIRESVDNMDRLLKSLEQNFLIRQNLPKESKGENIDAGLRSVIAE